MSSRWPALLLLLPLLACPPVRDDDPVADPVPWGNTLGAAFFTVTENDWSDYDEGRLSLVDDETWTCSDLNWGGGVPWWQFGYEDETEWVELRVILGDDAGGWDRDYVSSFTWFNGGGSWDGEAAFFYGSWGIGGYDDEPVPGRDTQGWIGEEADQADDSLEIGRYDDEEVRGAIEAVEGEWSFQATHCGTVYGDDDDGEQPPEDEPDEPEDDDDDDDD